MQNRTIQIRTKQGITVENFTKIFIANIANMQ